MLFNSYIFVLFFLPICIIGYFTINHFNQKMLAQIFLLGMSLWFYGYFNLKYLLIIISSIIFNYFILLIFEKVRNDNGRKCILGLALLFNLGSLFYFKYYDFFLENINIVFRQNFLLKGVLLPLGISFFTFQQLSFVIDAYQEEVPQYGFVYYASFVTFFPQLIAGPIVTHEELIPQFLEEKRKHFNWDNFAKGIYIFTLGLAKKVLLADTFGNAVNWGFANIIELNTADIIIIMLSYTIQIYFDFSGYCDMAIGIGKMLNIDLPVNFNSPYKALTITEFWNRWHITLTRFFTKYIYIPLGGNRKGTVRTYRNVMIVFLVSGLWHGANWTFILWGFCHGIFSVVTRYFKKCFDKLHPALNWLLTFSFLNVTWVIFRADTVKDAFQLIYKAVCLDFGEINDNIINCFNLPEFLAIDKAFRILLVYPKLCMVLFLMFAMFAVLGLKNAYEQMVEFRPTIFRLVVTAVLLVWCVFSFSGISTFLYFNF